MQWIADTIYRILRSRALTPRYISKLSLEMMQLSAGLLQYLNANPDDRAVWTEFQNKIEAFSLFEYVDFELNAQDAHPLRELVSRAVQLGPYRSVWTMEGIGHYYARIQPSLTQFPNHLFCKNKTEELPARSLLPLHTGMGLALAENVLESISKQPDADTRLIDTYAQLCYDNSREGCAGAVFEALGLVARNLYQQLIPAIDRHLSANDVFLAYFWHGVGRGIYFNPWNFPPFRSSPWKALDMCQSEPPHELGRQNAIAGLAWALTMVNIRHPQIMEVFLRHHGNQVGEDDVFANGVRSAMIIWKDATAADCHLKAFQEHVLRSSDPRFMRLWEMCVRRPCEDALHDRGSQPRSISDLFRYQHVSPSVHENGMQPSLHNRLHDHVGKCG